MTQDYPTSAPAADPSPPRRRFGTALAILAVGLLSVVVLVATRPEPARANLERVDPRVSVTPLEARSGVIVVEGTGTIRPRAEITLSPQVGGRVVRVSSSLTSGGAFRRGDVLLVIEPDSYENAVAIAGADVAQRSVEVALAQQEQIVAREEYGLLRSRQGGMAGPDTSLASRLAFREPQVEAARAALARAEAQLADAELNLTRTVVRAPFNGRVRSETVDVGQNVTPGQSMAELYDGDEAEMVVSLSTSEAALIQGLWDKRAGDDGLVIPARIRSEFGGVWHEWSGYVDRAEGALDATTRTVDVVVRIPAPFATEGGPPLLIGSYARATLDARRVERYFALPRTALREGGTVWVVDEGTSVRSVPVLVVQELQDSVFVTAELPVGTDIVTSDLTIMTEGMLVSVDRNGEG